jgi:outer membrane immunogenic protein
MLSKAAAKREFVIKVTLSVVASVLLSGVAVAQDWTGFYVGGQTGYSFGDGGSNVALGGAWGVESASLQSGATDLYSANLEPEGWGVGVHAGYNHQFPSGLVLGGEVSYTFNDIDASRATPQTVATSVVPALTYAVGNSVEVEQSVTARTNIGWSFTDMLGYVVIGYTWADTTAGAEVLSNGGYSKQGSGSEWLQGFTYGLGGAVPVADRWTLRVEYLRTNFDDLQFNTAYRPGSTFTSPVYTETYTQDLEIDTVQIGLSYRL